MLQRDTDSLIHKIIMRQSVALAVASLLVSAGLLIDPSNTIAHQQTMISNVQAVVHLEPDDSPYAGEPSFTWFHLINANDETIPLADCTCNLVVYDSQNQPIANPQLSEADVEEHERPITTTITFPSAGSYQLVFTGQPKQENLFEPFELTVPVTVRP